MDPGRVGVETMLTEIAKLRRLRELGLPAEEIIPIKDIVKAK